MDKKKDLLLGIDVGTTGTKCTFYDFEGNKAASGYQEYRMIHPQPGWTEQDPHKWWNAVKENIQLCIDTEDIDTSRVRCIGVSSTNAVMLIGKNDKVLYNGIGLHDQRADPQVAWLKEHVGDQRVFDITGNNIVKGSFALPTLRWFMDNRPQLIDEAEKFLIPNGYIIKKLTGEYSVDRPRSGLTLLNDLKEGIWSQEIADKAQIPERLLPPIYDSTSIVGTVTKKAADSTGLKAGTPVVAGAIDTISATVGVGAVNPGDVAVTIGSSGRVCHLGSHPIFDRRILETPGPIPHSFAAVQTTDNAGISLKWFRDTFGKMVLQDALSAGIGIYEQLSLLCQRSPVGAQGLIYLPYLSGEKSPIWDPHARGVFFGLNLDTTYSDFIRAIMEGVAFSIRHCMETLEPVCKEMGTGPIPIGGGIARSEVWCQIFADVLNRPMVQFLIDETETLGDAILAAQAVNPGDMPLNFGKSLTKKGKIKEPRPENRALYDDKFDKYVKLYNSVKELF